MESSSGIESGDEVSDSFVVVLAVRQPEFVEISVFQVAVRPEVGDVEVEDVEAGVTAVELEFGRESDAAGDSFVVSGIGAAELELLGGVEESDVFEVSEVLWPKREGFKFMLRDCCGV